MRKIYSSLLVLAMIMVSTVAKAQYTVEITSDPTEDWVAGQKSFAPAELATALGLADAAALKEVIYNGQTAEGYPIGGNVYIKTADGKSNAYTGNSNEFWMNADGAPQGYADEGTCWFVGIEFEDANAAEGTEDAVNVYVGQMPGVFKNIYEPSTLNTTLYLVSGEKEISFEVTQKVNAAVKSTLPDPIKELDKLTIVKDYTLTLDFIAGKSYEGKTYSTTLDGVYEALGTTASDLDAFAADMTFTQVVESEDVDGETKYSWLNELTTPEEGAGGGWYGRYTAYDEASGTETYLPMNAPKGWGTGENTFYVQNIKLADGEFSITSGQFPEILKEGDTDYAYLYVIVGDKAVRIKTQVSVSAPAVIDPNAMVKVGEASVDVTSPANNDYSTKSFTVDIAAIAEALGCEPTDLEDFYAYAAEGEISDNHTTNGGGYYFNEDGYIDTWGNKAPVFIDPDVLAEGKFDIGQYAGIFNEITEDKVVKIPLIFQNGANYYIVTVNYTVKAPSQSEEPAEYTLVSTESLSIQIIPGEEWDWETTSAIDLEYIESKIGTQDFTLYTDKHYQKTDDDDNVIEEGLEWSKSYTCTPAPGFWYGRTTYENADHQIVVDNAGWGTNSFGLTYKAGEITWYQYPGQSEVGDSWMANLYLVNGENGKYVKYVIYVSYVDEVRPEAETALKVDDNVTVTDASFNEDGVIAIDIDTEALYEALDLTDELLESVEFSVAKSQTVYSSIEAEEDALFSADGYAVSENDEFASLAHISLENGLQIVIDPQDTKFEKADESKVVVRFAIEYNGKRAIFAFTLLSEDSPLAINGIEEAKTVKAGIFNLAGQRLAAPQKGFNIINGKKIYVK